MPPEFGSEAWFADYSENYWSYRPDENRKTLRNPDSIAAGDALCEAMVRWRRESALPATSLMVDALNSSGFWIRNDGALAVAETLLAHEDPKAILTNLWNASRAPGRGRLAWNAKEITAGLPTETCVWFRTLGLTDRSKLVRGEAAYRAATSGLHDLLPALREMADSDPVPDLRETALRSWHLIKDGYRLEPENGFGLDGYDIWYLAKGRHIRGRTCTFVSAQTVENLGIERILMELHRFDEDLTPYSWDDYEEESEDA